MAGELGLNLGVPAGVAADGPAEMSAEAARLLGGLDDLQRLAVTSPAAPLCIRAGPGSGKTRVLTRRIAYRVANADCEARFTVAVTFTQRAAGELRARLQRLGIRGRVTVGTFHGLASRQLRRHAEDDGRPAPVIMANPAGVLASLLGPGESTRAVRAELDWCGARGLGAADYPDAAAAAGRRNSVPPDRMAEIMGRYAAAKRRGGLMDFADLLRLAAERLENDAATAEAWHWAHRHFFVDELQDLTPAQFRLLRAWLGDRPDLCAVGDPDQAIFGWGGADRRMLGDFTALFAGAEIIDLAGNYRCSPVVRTMAGALLHGDAAPGGAVGGAAGGGAGPARPTAAASLVSAYATAAEEAAGVAAAVRQGRAAGESWSAQAVLARTRRQVTDLAEALGAVGVPARVADPDAATLPDDADDAVCVSTMHAAKGLEWPVVHIAGLEEGLVPLAGATRGEALAEERRLLYVALTRARRRVHLSWAAERPPLGRSPAGRGEPRRPSRWLAALVEAAGPEADAAGARAPADARPAGRRPPDLNPPGDALVVALQAWRTQAARKARVAPTAVLGDGDLAALAENRPATIAEMGMVTGLGPARLSRWGSQLLDLVVAHSGEGEGRVGRPAGEIS